MASVLLGGVSVFSFVFSLGGICFSLGLKDRLLIVLAIFPKEA